MFYYSGDQSNNIAQRETILDWKVETCDQEHHTQPSVREDFEGIAGLRTDKTFKIAGPASLLLVFTVLVLDDNW